MPQVTRDLPTPNTDSTTNILTSTKASDSNGPTTKALDLVISHQVTMDLTTPKMDSTTNILTTTKASDSNGPTTKTLDLVTSQHYPESTFDGHFETVTTTAPTSTTVSATIPSTVGNASNIAAELLRQIEAKGYVTMPTTPNAGHMNVITSPMDRGSSLAENARLQPAAATGTPPIPATNIDFVPHVTTTNIESVPHVTATHIQSVPHVTATHY
ncbi:hepatitis A virus cellular receptor 1-like [Argopecten irradians]|uniref:hepatitis A virus cellular receptor 1-like n=1 Tax=Argopecten irradians TaxID=31199 RepID=UPI00372047D3